MSSHDPRDTGRDIFFARGWLVATVLTVAAQIGRRAGAGPFTPIR